MHEEKLKGTTENQKKILNDNKINVKPKFMIAGKYFDLNEMPSNVIADHLERELKKRDELGDLKLPRDRLKAFLRK